MRALQTFIFGLGLILLLSQRADAAVVYVNQAANPDSQDGLAWSTAFTTLQPAIDATFDAGGGEVWIAEGVYAEERVHSDPDTGRNTGALLMKSGVSLYGGFSGTEVLRGDRDTLRNRTVIDGSVARGGEPARQVVIAASNTTLDGLEIRGGDSGFRSAIGGGVIVERLSNVRIAGCLLTENAGVYGVGLRITFSENVTVERCAITSNVARGVGVPGLYIADSSVDITACTFTHNEFDGDEFDGGVVRIEGGSTRFRNCTFFRNIGLPLNFDARGGLPHEVVDCDFVENSGLSGSGGLRYSGRSTAGDFRIERCTFLSNQGNRPVFNVRENGALLDNSLDFAKNIAVRNCAIVNNTGEFLDEPVVLVGGANFVFDHCTFAGNYALTDMAKGIVMHRGPASAGAEVTPLLVRNAVFWNVTPEEFNFDPGDYTLPVIENSIVRGGFPGPGILDADPLFLNLVADDFRLNPLSPGVDAALFFTPISDDLFSSERPAGPASDLGAHEEVPQWPTLCESAALTEEQFAQLMHVSDPLTDLDRDGLPDLASLRLFAAAACEDLAGLGPAAELAFALNSEAANAELFDMRVLRRDTLIAALMSVGASAQAALRETLAESGAILLNNYAIVSCGPTPNTCQASLPGAPTGPNPALTGQGDYDADGITNSDEWEATLTSGGTLEDFIVETTDQAARGNSGGGGGGGCFIATAAYGTSFSGEIDALRTLRNERLLGNSIGAAFTDTYYRLSPPLADFLATHDTLRAAARKILAPLVAAAQRLNRFD